jgi:hypothetical protein
MERSVTVEATLTVQLQPITSREAEN